MTCVRLFLSLLLVSVLLTCAGCWEEVLYDPNLYDPNLYGPNHNEPSKLPPPAKDKNQDANSPTTKVSKPAQPKIDEAVAQPEEPLGSILDPQEDLSFGTDSPAPPAELDWLKDPSSPEPAELTESTASARTAIAAWQLGSKWSLAAAYFAKGLDASRTEEPLKQAAYASQLLEVDLPAMPEIRVKASLQPTVVRYLLEEGGPQLANQLDNRFPADHKALVELAIKSHALLLVYTPNKNDLEPLVSAITLAAENSGLPETVWRRLVDLLEQRAEYPSIKQAVFDLHDQAADFLAGSTDE